MVQNYNIKNFKPIKIRNVKTARINTVIPSYIKIVIQDAGMSPKTYIPHLQYLITPGSYLDPASRSKGDIFSEFDAELVSKDFINIGMHYIHSMKYTLYSDNSCDVHITFKDSKLNVKFDSKFHPISGDTTYFNGNTEKNEWFNLTSPLNYTKAIQYILCKELGDTLQAYYGIKFMKRSGINTKELCLFTNDNILMMRCQLLQLQVLYNTIRGTSESLFYHHPVMTDITEEFKHMYQTNLQIRNDGVIEDINSVLTHKMFYYHNGRIVRFTDTSNIANILRNCCKEIQIQTDKFLKIDSDAIDVNDYCNLSYIYYANSLFTNKVINPSIRSLFIKPTKDSRLFTPSFGSIMHGGDFGSFETTVVAHDNSKHLIKPTDHLTEYASLPSYTFPYGDYRDPYSDDSEPTHKIMHELFRIISSKHSDWSEDTQLYVTEQLYDMIYMYFSYECLSIWDPNILREIVNLYDTGTLGSMSHTEFNDFIQPLMDTYLPPKEFEQLVFEKYYFPKESDSRLPAILKQLEPTNSSPIRTRKTRRKPRCKV
jgi:hypothetical protein